MKEIKLELKEIELAQIDPNPENSQLFNMSNIEHLANIITEEGFTTPIEVYQKDDGRYEITSGHRRYEAMKLLGRKTIPCCVTDKYANDTTKDRKLLSSNIATRKLSPYEMAVAISFYEDILKKEKFKGNTRTKVAEYFGISESNVYRYKCILKLIPELQELCKKPQFPYSSLRAASILTSEEQKELYEELLREEKERISSLSKNEDDDIIDEIDVDEIVFSRTRIEPIINGKIRRKERIEEVKRQEETSSIDDFMNEPEEFIEEPVNELNLDEYIIKDSKDDDRPLINFDDIDDKYSTYIRGLNECLATLNIYKANKNSMDFKNEIIDKLKEMKELISLIESNL